MKSRKQLPFHYGSGVSKEEFWESESVFLVPFLDVLSGGAGSRGSAFFLFFSVGRDRVHCGWSVNNLSANKQIRIRLILFLKCHGARSVGWVVYGAGIFF